MKFFKRKTLFFVAVGIVMLMLFVPFLRFSLNAASLGPTYLFPERLKAGEATDMILLITPSTAWSTGTSDREIRIYFHPGEVADTEWCLANVALTSSAVSSAPVNLEDWTITTNLPGTLVASCVRGTGGAGQDYIKVTGVGELTADVGYGLKITGDAAKFKLGTAGSKIMTIQLTEAGGKIESTTFALQLLSDDQITVTADVDPADSISCSITPSSVPMGTLYKGGAYITAEQGLGLTTDAATGFYWAVYGTGDPSAGVNAGLWNSTESYLLSSAGDTVNLLTGEGFGMVVSTSAGATVATNFQATTPGIFGGISRGFNNAKLFLSNDTEPGSTVNSVVTLGARAGLSAGEGSYTETLTYICGAYIGNVAFACGDDVIDSRDSQVYPTVEIGTQCWMAKNLAYLPEVHSDSEFVTQGENSEPGYGVVGYDGSIVSEAKSEDNYDRYGVNYNWFAAVDYSGGDVDNYGGVQGACPTGWSVPTGAQFTTLTDFLSSDSQYICGGNNQDIAKSLASKDFWATDSNVCSIGNDLSANNSSGFNARPASARYTWMGGQFYAFSVTRGTGFYASTAPTEGGIWLCNDLEDVEDNSGVGELDAGFSVRCLRD